jgi:hypothetical protein
LFAVYFLADCDGGFDIEEGDYDAAERFERSPGVDRAMLVYRLADLYEIRRLEDLRLNKVLVVVSMGSCKPLRVAALTVMIRVFEGGEGCTSGGRSERSSESGDLDRDDVRECCGEGRSVAMAVVMLSRVWRKLEVCELWEFALWDREVEKLL